MATIQVYFRDDNDEDMKIYKAIEEKAKTERRSISQMAMMLLEKIILNRDAS